MTVHVRDLADATGTALLGVKGDMTKPVTGPASFDAATPGSIVFFNGDPEAKREILASCGASVVICRPMEWPYEPAAIFVQEPRLAFMRIVRQFFTPDPIVGIHETAIVSARAVIGENVSIGPYTLIDDDCHIGDGSVIGAHVHLYARTRVGTGVVIHSGTVIGADGFGYERNAKGDLEKFPHLGGVVIESNVEIGSNTSIDRGTLNDTVIGEGCKIDNQVHIAHNVVIGAHSVVIAQAMVGGSVTIGPHSWIAPAAVIRNNVRIGHHVTVGMGAVVTKDVADHLTVMGIPAKNIAS